MIKDRVLKNMLNFLILKFGLREINDKLSQICFEEAEAGGTQKVIYDDLSETYDMINEKFFSRDGSFRSK